ncbi:hypothetical protein B7L09_14265 [Pseudomonas mandelii]|nr:hypothetical protein B7L09_14265 [Pseudomonas mandelii]
MYHPLRSGILIIVASQSSEQRMNGTSTSPPSAPRKTTTFPAFGPTFISADDAAYWVHRHIGASRDKAYGGVIVQRGDGKFQPTLPVAGRMGHFDFDFLLTPGTPNELFAPPGYSGAAYYLSHSASHADVLRVHPGWTTEQVTLSLGFFSRAHLLSHMQDPGAYGQRHYLSGPDGSLIKYESTQPAEEKNLFELGFEAFGPFSDVEQLIQKVARTGTLSVLVANESWGGVRGNVPANWTLGTAAVRSSTSVQPFFCAVFDQVDKAIEAAAATVTASTGSVYLGFVVTSAGSAECMATYPVLSSEPAAELLKTFPLNADRTLERLLDFDLNGVYFMPQGDATHSASEPWLYERFFSPQELATGIRFSLGDVHRQAYPDYLKVYARTRDGAVLQYRPSAHLREVPLKDSADFNVRLKAGTLKPSDYIRQVATAGELAVLKDSALWDVVGIVGPDWRPYARSRRLSPAFLMADDAARFAHEHIGSRREQGFVGMILRDRNQRFVATEPVFAAKRFALDRLCPLDATGAPIMLVEGHSFHGLYASRWHADAGAIVRTDLQEQLTHAQMFTTEDIRSVFEKSAHVVDFYLSGSADSLLVYSPDVSKVAARNRLQKRVSVLVDGKTQIDQELAAGALEPGAVVDELAGTGRLRVVVGSDVWGPRGTVPGDESNNEVARTDITAPVLGAIFTSAEDAVLNARHRARLDYRAAAAGWGFILKHKEREEYVATEMVTPRRLGALNQASDFGAPVLIDEFRSFGLYHAASWMPKDLSTAEAWFARHFASIRDLAAAIYDEKGTQRLTHFQDLNIFIATLDGALLLYQYSASSTQFDNQGLPQLMSVQGEDTPPYANVIQMLAKAGELKVLRTSELWDEPGSVGPDWAPFVQIQRRALSPVFVSQDDAACHALAQLGSRRERVYGGLVLRRADGLFVATLPVPVEVENFPANWIRLDELPEQGLFLAGSTVVARYHSRMPVEPIFALSNRERDVYLAMFSTDFMAEILSGSGRSPSLSPGKEYLMGLDGSLISYTLSASASEKQLARALVPPSQLQRRHTPIELKMRNGTQTPSEYVNQVASAGRLQVIQGSRLWGEARQLSHWSAYPGIISTDVHRFAIAEPALSPVFTQMDDALRHVHRTVGARASLMFGFVLKALNGDRYVTTLPIDGRQGHLTVERVFPKGLLPSGYRVEGIYLCPSTRPGRLPRDIAHSFISPRDLSYGLDAVGVRTAEGSTYLNVYISCADGALLRYAPRAKAPEWTLFHATVAYEKVVQSGRESLIDYLRKVIANGELQVVVRSAFWSPLRVDARGVKTGIELIKWALDNRFALGPVFARADDAARSAQRLMGEYVGQPYLGGVLIHPASSSFVAVEPLEDGANSGAASALFYSGPGGPIAPVTVPGARPLPLPVFPQGYKWAAVHQFYKRFNLFVKDPNASDRLLMDNLALADLWFCRDVVKKSGVSGGRCYFTGRGGALFKFTPSFSPQETALFNEEAKDGVAAYLAALASVGRLEVLDTDGYWQRRGRLKATWQPPVQTTVKPDRDEL